MLVLSRKQDERIQIGEGVTVTVLGVKGNVVKIGIEAPKSVRILRGELPHWNDQPSPPATRTRRRTMSLAG
jgi:carbon storage regulator CsrA